jgi:hypothetical protein
MLLLFTKANAQGAQGAMQNKGGKNKKGTIMPSVSSKPSAAPTITAEPTTTYRPTLHPTVSPRPSVAPTVVHSAEPSKEPSVKVTGAPTGTPTLAPTSFTRKPTVSPAPTAAPIVAVTTVTIPEMVFRIVTSAPSTTRRSLQQIDEESLKQAIVEFLTQYLSESKNGKSLQRVSADQSVTTSSGNGASTATVDFANGQAIYAKDQAMSEEELRNLLEIYFSYTGVAKLKDFLVQKEFPVTELEVVSFDGKSLPASVVSDPGTNRGVNLNSTEPSKINPAVIAGIVIGGVVLILSMFVLASRTRHTRATAPRELPTVAAKKSTDGGDDSTKADSPVRATGSVGTGSLARSPAGNKEDDEDDDEEEVGETMKQQQQQPVYIQPFSEAKKKRAPEPAIDEQSDDGLSHYTSDGDIISVTESLLYEHQQGPLFNVNKTSLETSAPAGAAGAADAAKTGKTSVRGMTGGSTQQPAQGNPGFQYDASRLDNVISSAKRGNTS